MIAQSVHAVGAAVLKRFANFKIIYASALTTSHMIAKDGIT